MFSYSAPSGVYLCLCSDLFIIYSLYMVDSVIVDLTFMMSTFMFSDLSLLAAVVIYSE